jgi:hypothetical protein
MITNTYRFEETDSAFWPICMGRRTDSIAFAYTAISIAVGEILSNPQRIRNEMRRSGDQANAKPCSL